MKPYFTGDLYNVYALISLQVCDDGLARRKYRMASAGYSFWDMIHGPRREVDKTFRPDPQDTAAQMIAQSLDATLPELLLKALMSEREAVGRPASVIRGPRLNTH